MESVLSYIFVGRSATWKRLTLATFGCRSLNDIFKHRLGLLKHLPNRLFKLRPYSLFGQCLNMLMFEQAVAFKHRHSNIGSQCSSLRVAEGCPGKYFSGCRTADEYVRLYDPHFAFQHFLGHIFLPKTVFP